MANTIIIKNSSTVSDVPTVGQLEQGELAVNLLDEKLYSKNSSDAIFEIGGGISESAADALYLKLDCSNDPLTAPLEINANLLDLDNSAGSAATTFIVHNSAGGATLNINATTGNAQIGQTSGAGAAEDVWVFMTRNAGVSLRYNNSEKLVTTNTGITVSGDVSIGNNDYSLSDGTDTFTWSATSGVLDLIGTGGTVGVDIDGFYLYASILRVSDRSTAPTNTAGKAFIWSRNDVPNTLWFTDDASSDYPLGYNAMPFVAISASQNFLLAQVGYMMHKSSGGALTFTCATDSNTWNGATWVVHNDDTEDLTIGTSGTTLYWIEAGAAPVAGNVTVEQGGLITVYKRSATEFWAWGGKEAPAGSPSFDSLTSKTGGTGNYTTTGIFTAADFRATGYGAAATPNWSSTLSTGTGMYVESSNVLAFSSASARRLQLYATKALFAQPVQVSGADMAGTAATSHLSANFLFVDGKEAIDGNDTWLRLNQNGDYTSGLYTPNHAQFASTVRIDGHIDMNGNLVGDGASTISGIETLTIDSTGDITKASHGNYLYHQSTTYDDDQEGGITFSTSAPSGGADGDIWFEYT